MTVSLVMVPRSVPGRPRSGAASTPAFDSLADIETLFRDIPLSAVRQIRTTANSIGPLWLALVVTHTLANTIAYLDELVRRGVAIDAFAGKLFMFLSAGMDLIEEIAKFRASRVLWSDLLEKRYGAAAESRALRVFAYTAGSNVTAQAPYTNVVRVILEALAAVLGGVQTLDTSGFDEALGTPTLDSVTLAPRTQQVILEETSLRGVADPLGGAHVVEHLTDELIARVRRARPAGRWPPSCSGSVTRSAPPPRRRPRRPAELQHIPFRTTEQDYPTVDPTFDSYSLTEEHQAVREAVRKLAEAEIAPHAAEADENEQFPTASRDALNRAGFGAIHIPEAYGGDGADSVATCIVIEEVARVCASSSLIPAVNKLGTMPILLAGSEDLKRLVLPSIASGEAMASYALSEREAGSDTASMRARARLDGDHWVLNGTKAWITNAGESTWYTVFAVSDPDAAKPIDGISAFVVHRDDPGFEIGSKERKLGIKGSPTREIHFVDCTIPLDRVIGEPGTGLRTALATLDHTRPTIGAQAVGIAQGALDAAISYVKERRQFRRPIADNQAVQFMLADMGMKIEAARHMVYVAAARAERGEPNLGFISAAAKCFASDVAMEVTTDAVQLFGGAGYTRDFPVERMMRDAKITQIYEGTNQIQRIVMSRALLRA